MRLLWALGILICAGARSAVTARALSPNPGPSRPGPDRDPRLWAREEIGGLAAGWVLISMTEEGTATANAVVTGNARGRAQDLDDVRSSQRVSACVRIAVANACTTVPLMLAPLLSPVQQRNGSQEVAMDGVKSEMVTWAVGRAGEGLQGLGCTISTAA